MGSTLVYTLGYQGLDIDRYLRILATSGIGLVADVRDKPWSHKSDFCQAALEAHLDRHGIGYRHVRSVGNPSSIRYSAKTTGEALDRYRDHLEKNSHAIEDMLRLISEANGEGNAVCLTCFEGLHTKCHRSVLADLLVRRDSALVFEHLSGVELPLFG